MKEHLQHRAEQAFVLETEEDPGEWRNRAKTSWLPERILIGL